MVDDNSLSRDDQLSIQEYKIVTQQFYSEIDFLCKLTSLFIVLNGILLTLVSSEVIFTSASILRLLICFFGGFISVLWLIIWETHRFYLKYRIDRALSIEERFDNNPKGLMQIFHASVIFLKKQAKFLMFSD